MRQIPNTALAFAALVACAPAPARADRADLWHVVHYACGGMAKVFGLSLPCLKVDRDAGYAVLRAPNDTIRILIAPTRRVTGIESPDLLRPDAPPFWAYAWENRSFVAAAAPRRLDWSDYAMAVNSRAGRSQDQLHIHVACVDPRVKAALARHPPGHRWAPIDLGVGGLYRVRHIEAADLGRNPFRMVAEEIPGARANMARHALAIVAVGPERGQSFALLDDPNDGHSEGLLDLDCRR